MIIKDLGTFNLNIRGLCKEFYQKIVNIANDEFPYSCKHANINISEYDLTEFFRAVMGGACTPVYIISKSCGFGKLNSIDENFVYCFSIFLFDNYRDVSCNLRLDEFKNFNSLYCATFKNYLASYGCGCNSRIYIFKVKNSMFEQFRYK